MTYFIFPPKRCPVPSKFGIKNNIFFRIQLLNRLSFICSTCDPHVSWKCTRGAPITESKMGNGYADEMININDRNNNQKVIPMSRCGIFNGKWLYRLIWMQFETQNWFNLWILKSSVVIMEQRMNNPLNSNLIDGPHLFIQSNCLMITWMSVHGSCSIQWQTDVWKFRQGSSFGHFIINQNYLIYQDGLHHCHLGYETKNVVIFWEGKIAKRRKRRKKNIFQQESLTDKYQQSGWALKVDEYSSVEPQPWKLSSKKENKSICVLNCY